MPGLAITTAVVNGIGTISPVGDVDISTAAQFRAALAAAVATHVHTVVDLTASSYFDSSGLQVLFEFAERLSEVVVPTNRAMQRLFALVGLDQVLRIRLV